MKRIKLIILTTMALSLPISSIYAQKPTGKVDEKVDEKEVKKEHEAYINKQKSLLDDLSKNDKRMQETAKKREEYTAEFEEKNQQEEIIRGMELERAAIQKEKDRIRQEAECHQAKLHDQRKLEKAYYKDLSNKHNKAEREKIIQELELEHQAILNESKRIHEELKRQDKFYNDRFK